MADIVDGRVAIFFCTIVALCGPAAGTDQGVPCLPELDGAVTVCDGDLVFRASSSLLGTLTHQFSVHDDTYSHAGIVTLGDESAHVIHASPHAEKGQTVVA